VLVLVVVTATVVVGASEVDIASVESLLLELHPETSAVEIKNPRTTEEIVDRKRTLISLAGGSGIRQRIGRFFRLVQHRPEFRFRASLLQPKILQERFEVRKIRLPQRTSCVQVGIEGMHRANG
jgi:hypothetical protein